MKNERKQAYKPQTKSEKIMSKWNKLLSTLPSAPKCCRDCCKLATKIGASVCLAGKTTHGTAFSHINWSR
jgi:hypothetical protein